VSVVSTEDKNRPFLERECERERESNPVLSCPYLDPHPLFPLFFCFCSSCSCVLLFPFIVPVPILVPPSIRLDSETATVTRWVDDEMTTMWNNTYTVYYPVLLPRMTSLSTTIIVIVISIMHDKSRNSIIIIVLIIVVVVVVVVIVCYCCCYCC